MKIHIWKTKWQDPNNILTFRTFSRSSRSKTLYIYVLNIGNMDTTCLGLTVSIYLFVPGFSGIPYQQRSIRLKCVIECFPLCDIVWHRNGKPIPILTERSNNGIIQASGSFDTYSKFVVRTEQKPPDHTDNILEHVESALTIVSHYFFSSKNPSLLFPKKL